MQQIVCCDIYIDLFLHFCIYVSNVSTMAKMYLPFIKQYRAKLLLVVTITAILFVKINIDM